MIVIRRRHLWVIILFMLFKLTARGEFIADGVTLTPLTDDGKSAAISWAFRSDRIALLREVSDSQNQLVVMKADRSDVLEASPVGNPFYIRWSWGGSKLAYEFSNSNSKESQGGVWVYDLDKKESVPFSAPAPRMVFDPAEGPVWSYDDTLIAYKITPSVTKKDQVWVADTRSGRLTQLRPDRGEMSTPRWSPTVPGRLALMVQANGERKDAAIINPDGSGLTLLTSIGAQSASAGNPRWNPLNGGWISYTNDIAMTDSQRDMDQSDIWICRPDGTQARNLTNSATAVSEKQMHFWSADWSWDGRSILSRGQRCDQQGTNIDSFFLIDPVKGGVRTIMTSHPAEDGVYNRIMMWKWSYDGTKIAAILKRSNVKNWGGDVQFESLKWVLAIYDVKDEKWKDLLVYDEQQDRKLLRTFDMAGLSFSPDNRTLLFTVSDIVSKDDGIYNSNAVRLDLPDSLVDRTASEHVGPPAGIKIQVSGSDRHKDSPAPPAGPPLPGLTTNTLAAPPLAAANEGGGEHGTPAGNGKGGAENGNEVVTMALTPLHLTAEEVMGSLPPKYADFISVNAARNILLFNGSPAVLESFRRDLQVIDTPAPHILVDLLAVELSDQANRNLGLDWTYAEGRFGFFQPEGNSLPGMLPLDKLGGLTVPGGTGQSFYQGVGKLPREFFVRLNSLVSDGEATILANPRTVSMSGKQSMIQIRRTVNFFFNEGFDTSGRPIVKKSDISADTVGKITPVLLADGRIHLTVNVSVGTFTFSQSEDLPEQTSRQSDNDVTVREGETIVIGGLRQQELVRTITKVPLLGSIPLVKALFTKKESTVKNSVLTIFITPQILKEEETGPSWPQYKRQDFERAPIMKDMVGKNFENSPLMQDREAEAAKENHPPSRQLRALATDRSAARDDARRQSAD